MVFDSHSNFAYSTVLASPAISGTELSIQIVDATLFPAAPFNVTVWPADTNSFTNNAEILRVISVSGNDFTVLRAQESTSARNILVGDQIAATITTKTLTDIETTCNASSPAIQTNIVYVDKNGSDTTGNGSVSKPFQTVQAAVSSITDSTIYNPYVIDIGLGNFGGDDITLMQGTCLKGKTGVSLEPTYGVSQGTVLTMNITSVGNPDNENGYGRCMITDMSLYQGYSGIIRCEGGFDGQMSFLNCHFFQTEVYTSRTDNKIHFKNCSGNATASGGIVYVTGFTGNFIVSTNYRSGAVDIKFAGCVFGDLYFQNQESGVGSPITAYVTGCYANNFQAYNDAAVNMTINVDAVALKSLVVAQGSPVINNLF